MYKIETHLHTVHVSKCGHLEAPVLAEAYHKAGYAAICVTDHYNRDTVRYLNLNLRDTQGLLERFLDGYRRMCEACAPYGIRVYRGAELRFDECQNDYLLYDWPDDLLRDFDRNMSMSIVDFAPLSRAAGALLIQAHPFRDPCVAAIACYLDGVEVLNAHPRHDSRNDLALHYAQVHHLSIQTAGSDCHQTPDIARSGILSDTLPADTHEFAQLLRSGSFRLITPPRSGKPE
jgi:hypothetical protein